MKILHYLMGIPPVRTGGLPRYVLDLAIEQKKQKNNVFLLIPGPINKGKKSVQVKKWKQQNGLEIYRIINPIYVGNGYGISEPLEFMPVLDVDVYMKWLSEIKPEIIHIHSLMGLHKEFLLAGKKLGIPIVFTTHDYYGLCPKIDLMCNEVVCEKNVWNECVKCCSNAYSVEKLRMKQSDFFYILCSFNIIIKFGNAVTKFFKKIIKTRNCESVQDKNLIKMKSREFMVLQEYYQQIFSMVDFFHFNSEQARRVYEKKLGQLNGKVISITNAGVSDCRKEKSYKSKQLQIAYLGGETQAKGFYYLINELDLVFEKDAKIVLNTYIENIKTKRRYINNHKPFTNVNQRMVYQNMDVLVVPSIWKETFGMVVLEALSCCVPVIVSCNVGARDILEKYEGLGIVIDTQEGKLAKCILELNEKRELLKEMNDRILEVQIDFSHKKHVERILELYHDIINASEYKIGE